MKELSVFVLDDEMTLAKMIKSNLESVGGFEVFIGDKLGSIDAVVNYVRDNKFHLIILDELMPNMMGHDIVKALHDSDDTRRIPIIVMSGLGEMIYNENDTWSWEPQTDLVKNRGDIITEKVPELAKEIYGVEGFLPKPFIFDDLLALIEGIME